MWKITDVRVLESAPNAAASSAFCDKMGDDNGCELDRGDCQCQQNATDDEKSTFCLGIPGISVISTQ